ncbi:MAG: phosphonate ABC transporter, permease protein PhnE [Anaerolineales bacterium]
MKSQRGSEPPKPSMVPPAIAAALSLLLPGLGQILGRSTRRGLVLIFSMTSILGLLTWRIRTEARRETELIEIIKKAYDLQPILRMLTLVVIILIIWIAVDAYLVAKRSYSGTVGLFFFILVAFFGLGWQIGEIDLVALATQAKDAGPFMGRVLWPWEKAITREEFLLVGEADIQIPCTDAPPPPSEEMPDQPLLLANPTCGELSEQGGIQGTTLTIIGKGFEPDIEIEIYWRDPIGGEFRQRQAGEYVKVTPDENGKFEMDIIMPYRLIPPSAGAGPQTWELQARQLGGLGKAELSTELKLSFDKMIETIFLGLMATIFGIVLAVPISFLAARNLMSASSLTLVIYFGVRTILNIVRSIEPLIWAVIAVVVVGLGPFAGILALTLHSIAALGKLYSESIESIDPGPIEAIQATGANWVQTVMFAVVPQIIPPFVSFTIYRWDINVRMSTIIGLVGGGGIGFLLIQWIRLLDYRAAGIAVWLIAVTVAVLDYVSAEIRQRFV